MELRGTNVLIVGLARSGVAAAVELSGMGARVTANDIRPEKEMEETVEKLSSKGIKLVLGGHPLTLLDDTDLIVVSPGVPSDIPLLNEAKKRDIPVVSELEVGYWFTKAPVIAVTGTNGKTTTTTLIGEILKNDGKNISVAGNIGTPLIQEADKNGSKDYIVVEVSSFQLENIVHFKPKISVILNITEDHLNRHKTFENYIEAKARILENQDEEDFAVLNYDDPIVASLAERARSRVVFFSRKQELPRGISVKNGVIVIRENGDIYPILKAKELGIKGSHNLENALAAVAVAWITKTNLNNLAETLKDFRGVEHRMEYVDTIDGVKFINDSKGTNPDAAQKALEAVDGPIILIAGGYDKKVDFRPFVRSFFGRVKKVILLGATADQIERTAREEGFFEVEKAASMREAVEIAKRSAEPGDTVLLSPACASWDMFANFEERGRVFKEAVRSLKA
ncbi:UDP-N-acetylmuramoyl-L-alanine--D-glutamate ligase [Thermosediminibacter litoriperuensis]|uniref:UDP-N-acetylmuramoylalanine--D-glutamate ligase n=1 Tax=Thermosediminibacter litoriperuensis TaxID=291989 RepID=A0A5S5ATC2_9FIRM|nr:UDP-N-acetylmuramoyl-L-alanine--D-glutamate ligase [Thermosediminibacter litoriperuensis]TYP54944.1 UDP-N-acetylmuramoylalanine--D-glutamate ligase [Thermosediminibacter litoriperuensis]